MSLANCAGPEKAALDKAKKARQARAQRRNRILLGFLFNVDEAGESLHRDIAGSVASEPPL